MSKWQFRSGIDYSHCEIMTDKEDVAIQVKEILINKMNLEEMI